jgi:N-acetylmuramoyl-L-alanine amidase
MKREDRKIKRRLLRELVDQNIALITGEPDRPSRRRGGLARALRLIALLASPVALLASSLVLSGAVGPNGSHTLALRASGPRQAAAEPSPGPVTSTTAAAPAQAPEKAAETAPAPTRDREPGRGPELAAELSTAPIDADVFPLAVRRIVLDPGHGGTNVGTRTPGGLKEKDLTLDIARRVREILQRDAFDVLMTRDADESVTLEERADFANQSRADIFVSIHVNWFEGSRESGVETYFLGPTDDPFLTRLAADENRDSGHSMAELRELLDRIYAGVRQDKSLGLAREIHRALYRSLHRVNPNLHNRGVKTAPFIVLVDTEMPAVLAEVAALSSQAEAAMLEKPLYREYIAESLASGIVSYARSIGSAAEPEPAAQQKGS